MMNSAASSDRPSLPCRPIKWLIYAIIAISFIGFLDASYLTINHYTGKGVNCSLTNGCEEVLTSKYATVFNIPVALFGALFYLTVFILAFLYTDTKKPIIPKALAGLTSIAFISSLYFVYLQFFVLKALCQYCLLSASLSTLLFILAIIVLVKKK